MSLQDIPKFPLQDFMDSTYPILMALVLGVIIGIRIYMRGTKCSSEAKLNGKVAVVTGANCGIGYEIAKNLAFRGARVIMACRDEEKTNQAITDIKKSLGDKLELQFMKIDLTSFASVREFAATFSSKEKKLDILINNAGVMCHPLAKTTDGNEMHFQTNYLGHFLLTQLLLEKLKAAPEGARIVNITANAYRLAVMDLDDLQFEQREYKAGDAYAQSKLAIMLFTYELSKRLQDSKVTVNVANPGVVRTNIHRHMPFRQHFFVSLTFAPFIWYLMKSPFDGAQTPIYCAVAAEEDGVSGKTYSECQLTDVEPNAVDSEMASNLWNASLRICGLTPL